MRVLSWKFAGASRCGMPASEISSSLPMRSVPPVVGGRVAFVAGLALIAGDPAEIRGGAQATNASPIGASAAAVRVKKARRVIAELYVRDGSGNFVMQAGLVRAVDRRNGTTQELLNCGSLADGDPRPRHAAVKGLSLRLVEPLDAASARCLIHYCRSNAVP